MSSAILSLYKGDYTQSELNTLCSVDGTVVLDNNTKRLFAGFDTTKNKAIVYGSNVDDVVWNATANTLTIQYINGTSQVVSLATFEKNSNKVTSLSSSSTDTEYPSAKCVYDSIRKKPVVVWQATTVSEGIFAAESDMSANPNWQLTNLDMSEFKTVELYIRSGGNSDMSYTPSVVIEIDLDEMNKSAFNHYIGSAVVQGPNDRNRLLAVTAAVSENKTSVFFSRCTSLYGTEATDANNNGRILYKILGYYD